MRFGNVKQGDQKQQKERFCAKSHILCKQEIFSAESKKCSAEVNLSGKIDKRVEQCYHI